MTQPNNPAPEEAIQNSLAALKMIEGSFFEGSPEQRAIETALHSIEESAALQRETGGDVTTGRSHKHDAGTLELLSEILFGTKDKTNDCILGRVSTLESELSQLRAANGDIGQAVENVLRECNLSHYAQMAGNAAVEAVQEYTRPSVLFRPTLTQDGNQWCALYGKDLQEGVAAFGDSPAKAMWAFDDQWHKAIQQREQEENSKAGASFLRAGDEHDGCTPNCTECT